MKKKFLVIALLTSAAFAQAQTAASAIPSSPAKKELVQKLMVLQQPGIEGLARNLVEQPAMAMLQAAGRALPNIPADKREAAGKTIEADIKKYVDEATPVELLKLVRPQLYVKGEFVGGCDIITEMYQSGELETMLTEKGVPHQAAA